MIILERLLKLIFGGEDEIGQIHQRFNVIAKILQRYTPKLNIINSFLGKVKSGNYLALLPYDEKICIAAILQDFPTSIKQTLEEVKVLSTSGVVYSDVLSTNTSQITGIVHYDSQTAILDAYIVLVPTDESVSVVPALDQFICKVDRI